MKLVLKLKLNTLFSLPQVNSDATKREILDSIFTKAYRKGHRHEILWLGWMSVATVSGALYPWFESLLLHKH